jgi:hypothetical protein
METENKMYKEIKKEEPVNKEREADQDDRNEYEELDEQLMQTFPASDPLSYY